MGPGRPSMRPGSCRRGGAPVSGRSLKWSPYGRQLPLAEVDGALATELVLGAQGTPPVGLRLARSAGATPFDRLSIDFNRNGAFEEDELLETTPTERNHKHWSSFDAVVDLPVVDPISGVDALDLYPLALWYVEDPRVPEEDPVLRFSRQGWMEGTAVLDGIEAVVLLTESVMDGVFGPDEAWALASRDSASDVLDSDHSRSIEEHAWLFEKAYRATEVDPSGRRLVLTPFDPGMSRREEEEMNDEMKVDREAARSGRSVAFLRDFAEATERARGEGKALLIDFETTWCGPCKVMDQWVYTADEVVDASSPLIAVKVDGDERLDLKDRFGVSGFPTMILVGPAGEELHRATGYVNVLDMTAFLQGRE